MKNAVNATKNLWKTGPRKHSVQVAWKALSESGFKAHVKKTKLHLRHKQDRTGL